MSVLPKIIYLFNMIPSLPNPSWLNSLNTAISHFYWKNKPPHIKLQTLQKPKSQGGLEALNFELYHLSSQLKYRNIYRKPLHFTSWKHKGITHLHHILHDSRLIHFQQLIQKFKISSNHYLKYLQLKSTILPKLN